MRGRSRNACRLVLRGLTDVDSKQIIHEAWVWVYLFVKPLALWS